MGVPGSMKVSGKVSEELNDTTHVGYQSHSGLPNVYDLKNDLGILQLED